MWAVFIVMIVTWHGQFGLSENGSSMILMVSLWVEHVEDSGFMPKQFLDDLARDIQHMSLVGLVGSGYL